MGRGSLGGSLWGPHCASGARSREEPPYAPGALASFNPWVGKIPWRREWLPFSILQYSCLENSMDKGAWQATLHGVTKSWTQLSKFHFHVKV